MDFGTIDGEQSARIGIEIDDQDSLEDIKRRWQLRLEEEGVSVSATEVERLAQKTYNHYFDENGEVRAENIETR